jgi:hypothetical protein
MGVYLATQAMTDPHHALHESHHVPCRDQNMANFFFNPFFSKMALASPFFHILANFCQKKKRRFTLVGLDGHLMTKEGVPPFKVAY